MRTGHRPRPKLGPYHDFLSLDKREGIGYSGQSTLVAEEIAPCSADLQVSRQKVESAPT
ncbi:hypothetical protein SBA2_30080 [Acidobacteriia bacterium SbA2]|nr:hypothetical protein SBA2_30080 [Acidobacteriia bacterium SbA2]